MARSVEPSRGRRKTGNRPLPGQAKPFQVVELPVDRVPAPPESLPEPVHELWRELVEELAGGGLRASDLELLEVACQQALRRRLAAAHLELEGMTVVGAMGGLQAHPMIKVERDAAVTYLRVANELGLTRAARVRLGLMQIAGQSLLERMSGALSSDR